MDGMSKMFIHSPVMRTRTTEVIIVILVFCWAYQVMSVVSALTLLVEQQEDRSAIKNLSDVMLAWLSICSKVQLIAYGPADSTATPSSLAIIKSRMVFLLVPAYPGFLKKAIKWVLFSLSLLLSRCVKLLKLW